MRWIRSFLTSSSVFLSVGRILLTQLVLMGPHENCVISSACVFSEQKWIYYPLLYSLAILIRRSCHCSFLTCRTINTHGMFSLWHLVHTDIHYRTISELQNSSQILRLFVVHSALLLSSVLSLISSRCARIWRNLIAIIICFCHPHITYLTAIETV